MEKVHAVVARSTFGSQKWQNTRGLGRLLEVEMWKKCTPLWREAHLEVKMYKTPQVRATFGSAHVEKVYAVVAPHFWKLHKKCTPLWREAHFEENVKITTRSGHFWTVRCGKSARRCGAKHILMKNVKITACSGQFLTIRWRVGCRKSARRCGAKHIWKSKVLKTAGFEPLLTCQMSFC